MPTAEHSVLNMLGIAHDQAEDHQGNPLPCESAEVKLTTTIIGVHIIDMLATDQCLSLAVETCGVEDTIS